MEGNIVNEKKYILPVSEEDSIEFGLRLILLPNLFV